MAILWIIHGGHHVRKAYSLRHSKIYKYKGADGIKWGATGMHMTQGRCPKQVMTCTLRLGLEYMWRNMLKCATPILPPCLWTSNTSCIMMMSSRKWYLDNFWGILLLIGWLPFWGQFQKLYCYSTCFISSATNIGMVKYLSRNVANNCYCKDTVKLLLTLIFLWKYPWILFRLGPLCGH